MLINSVAGGGGAEILLAVSVASGAVVTATKGNLTVTGVAVDGLCTLSIPEAGEWTVSATLEDMTSDTQTVTVVGNYSSALTFGDSVGQKAVGSSVYLNVDGVQTEFLVVQQGKPDSTYDDSCDGTWLLMRGLRSKQAIPNATTGQYFNNGTAAYVNSLLSLFDTAMQGIIKEVRIPYCEMTSSETVIHSGADGLQAKVFLLSGPEVGFPNATSNGSSRDGAKLGYFDSGTGASAKAKRAAVENWLLRSTWVFDEDQLIYVYASGDSGYGNATYKNGYCIRPAIIVPSGTLVTNDGMLRA